MNASEAAFAAAQLMSEKGHCKGTLWDDQGRVCFNGAILQASVQVSSVEERAGVRWTEELEDIRQTATEILAGRGWQMCGSSDPVLYNNDPSVTAEDVIMLLKECGERISER